MDAVLARMCREPRCLVVVGLAGIVAMSVVGRPNAGIAETTVALGAHDALRTYVEFADGRNRGMYDPETQSKGYPDEDYDATTAMVINWHTRPEDDAEAEARLRYRRVHPEQSEWRTAQGEAAEFWHRDEVVNRVVLTGLEPDSVYEYQVTEEGRVFRLRTMPASLADRPVRIVFTGDHQSPGWSGAAHANARRVAAQKPDMFVVAGDFVNCEGQVNAGNAERWATYLDYLYHADDGYFLYALELDGQVFENVVIPHVGVLGNHETGERHHIRWPACVNTGSSEPGYPQYVAANWMQLLFHWPYSSEGFYSEFNPDHPNMNPDHVREGFGKGGFGSLRFGEYLMLIGLDNSQNFEGEPDIGLRDWEGNLITDRWPWYETHHADVRQDLWLKDLLEPEDGPDAGEVYTHIIPVFHRGLFGTVRLNMSLKNRALLKYWLPPLYRNDVKLIKEGHDHLYTRTVPMKVTDEQPSGTYIEKVYYEPNTWPLPDGLPQEYLDDYFAVDVLKDERSDEIVGWAYAGHYVTYDGQGMIAQGHGGWAAGRRSPGQRGGGNAGLWFVDEQKGGQSFGGSASLHTTTVVLGSDEMIVKSYRPTERFPIHKARWDVTAQAWQAFDFSPPAGRNWVAYEWWRQRDISADVERSLSDAEAIIEDESASRLLRTRTRERRDDLEGLLADLHAPYESIMRAVARLEQAVNAR